jgi:hypothetical protein
VPSAPAIAVALCLRGLERPAEPDARIAHRDHATRRPSRLR